MGAGARLELGELGGAHEEAVALAGGTAALVEGPDHEALAAATVAGGEDIGDAGGIAAVVGLDVGARVALEVERLQQGLLGPKEAHGEEDELGGDDAVGAGQLDGHEGSLLVLFPADLDEVDAGDVAGAVADELLGGGEIDAGISPELGGGLLLAVVHLVHLGPLGPRVVGGALHRRLGHDFQLDHALAAVAQAGAYAVGAGIATTDDDDVLALGVERRDAAVELVVELIAGVGGEELHRQVDALGVAVLDGKVAAEGGTAAENLDITKRVFAGEKGAYRDAILLNAAAAIAAFKGDLDLGIEQQFANGLVLAKQGIDSGAATQLVERWADLSNELAKSSL